MGNASPSEAEKLLSLIKVPTKSGFLRILVQSAHIQHQTSSVFKMDPYVKLNMGHQKFQTKTQLKGGSDPNFNQTFQFAINSCYQKYGRNLQVQIWDKNKISDSQIGYGIIDLDPIIKLNKLNQRMKCFVNYQRKPAGYVFIVAQFKQCPSQTLAFRFQTSFLRRKVRTIGDMDVRVKVTIGQQILQTKPCKDNKDIPPKWANQILTFQVPTLLKQGKIQLMDQNNLIGQVDLNIKQLLQGKKEKQFNEDVFFEQNPGKSIVAGSLKYSTLYGIDGKFSEIQDIKKKYDSKISADQGGNKNDLPETNKNHENTHGAQNNMKKQQPPSKINTNIANNSNNNKVVNIDANKSNVSMNINENINNESKISNNSNVNPNSNINNQKNNVNINSEEVKNQIQVKKQNKQDIKHNQINNQKQKQKKQIKDIQNNHQKIINKQNKEIKQEPEKKVQQSNIVHKVENNEKKAQKQQQKQKQKLKEKQKQNQNDKKDQIFVPQKSKVNSQALSQEKQANSNNNNQNKERIQIENKQVTQQIKIQQRKAQINE